MRIERENQEIYDDEHDYSFPTGFESDKIQNMSREELKQFKQASSKKPERASKKAPKRRRIPWQELNQSSYERLLALASEGPDAFDAETWGTLQGEIRDRDKEKAKKAERVADDQGETFDADDQGAQTAYNDHWRLILLKQEQAAKAMKKHLKDVLGKDGKVIRREYDRNDLEPLVTYLDARGVYRETFCTDNGLRLDGEELTSAALTCEQMAIQRAGYPKMGTAGPRLMKQAAEFVASQHERDGLKWFFEQELPKWDGTPRIDSFFETYCGGNAEKSRAEHEYLVAVARYMFTAIVGRAFATASKPCKADYCITLVGESGCDKTSFCRALCVNKRFYKEVNTETPEDEWQRALREVHIVEIGEIHETTDKHLQAMKRILSAETVKVRKKGVDENFYFAVRAFTFATADQSNVLNDPAGNRRFIPVNVRGFKRVSGGALCMDIEGIEAAKPQLYAEALALWKKHGVMWNGIPEDVRQSHAAEITQVDERVLICIEYMKEHNLTESTIAELWVNALEGQKDRLDKRTSMALAKEFRLSRRFRGPMTKRFGTATKKVWQLLPEDGQDEPADDDYDPDERF